MCLAPLRASLHRVARGGVDPPARGQGNAPLARGKLACRPNGGV